MQLNKCNYTSRKDVRSISISNMNKDATATGAADEGAVREETMTEMLKTQDAT